MDTYTLSLVIILSFFMIMVDFTRSQVVSKSFSEIPAFINRINDTFHSEYKTLSSIHCALVCASIVGCIFYFVHSTTLYCRIMLEAIGYHSTRDESNWKFYRASICQQPSVYGSEMLPISTNIGESVSYNCAVGFEPANEYGTITCSSDGSWTPPTLNCSKCSLYSNFYVKRQNRYLAPEGPVFNYSPTFADYNLTREGCTELCTERTEFKCAVAYYKKSIDHYVVCLHLPVRFEENTVKFAPYYNTSANWDEYIRLCN